jgi:hypothetical protein
VDLQTMIDGVSFWYISETDDSISLFPMPSDFCYITAPWNYGFLFAIDLTYFDKYVSIPEQIPELKHAYEIFVKKREELYKGEALAPYQYYQIPPNKGWVFTFDPIHPDKVPPLSNGMSASLDILSYKELLKNKIALDLYKIIPMKIPLDKDNKKMAIPYKLAEEITQTIQMLLPENIKVFSSPFDTENAVLTDQSNRFDDITNVRQDTFYSATGLNKPMFGSRDTTMAAAMQISEMTDFGYASYHSYRQYENFMNYQLSIRTKKYKFQVQMFGNLLKDKEERELALSELQGTNTGILDFFAAKGYEPFQVKSTLLLEKSLGLRDLMIPIQSMYTQSGKSGGRPESDVNSESGEITKSYDSNNQKFALNKCIYCGNILHRNAVDGVFCCEECKEDYCAENAQK